MTDIDTLSIPLEVVREGGGFKATYRLNRQALVPRAWREPGLDAMLEPFLSSRVGEASPVAGIVSVIPPETAATETFEVRPTFEPREGRRFEARLVKALEAWWIARDGRAAACRLEIRPAGTPARLYVDLYNLKTKELVEAKASCDRAVVRMAIGQLADYGRFVEGSSAKVLLPERPSGDLLSVLWSQGIGVLVPDGAGFAEIRE